MLDIGDGGQKNYQMFFKLSLEAYSFGTLQLIQMVHHPELSHLGL